MATTDFERVRSIFLAALERPPKSRDAYVAGATGEDAALRGQVEVLLMAHAAGGGPLDDATRSDAGVAAPAAGPGGREDVGVVIAGRYKLLERIGEGGMGAVWLARQSEPVRRKVAVKLIKLGMDSRQVVARFEAERQALAMMDHPNIAKVLDGGLTDSGRPYFVMEYVKGVPITEYCDAARLDVAARLDLFAQVCQAVQHAHQKGVIHRDLKPSNILVAPYDDRPVPKVIDFGLAKATHQPLTERTLHTAHESVLGTPMYMSPEQAQLNNVDVDTRSDIYSLGVLLYELLTGTTPLDKRRFKAAAWDEVRRIIREEEPPRPSTRLSTAQALPTLAAGRDTEPHRLTRLVRGELDWIVMKALEKDRARRYETVGGFAADVRRYLAGEPVLAVPPTAAYRARKFVHRYRGRVVAAGLLLAALLAGTGGTTFGLIRATRSADAERQAKRDAEDRRADAERQKARAEAGEALAKERLAQVVVERDAKDAARQDAEATAAFLHDLLQSPDPNRDGREIRVVELLDRAAARLGADGGTRADRRAGLQATLGMTYSGLGLSRQAIPLLEQVLEHRRATDGPEHAATLGSMSNLASAYYAVGRRDEALKLLEEAHALCGKVLGPGHPHTLSAMGNLAASYLTAGRRDEALKLHEETLARCRKLLGPEHPRTLSAMGNLAASYHAAGRHAEALELQAESQALCRKVHGPEHPTTVTASNNLALAYHAAGRSDEAHELWEEVLPASRRALGPEHPHTLMAMINLSRSYLDAGRHEEALKLHEETLALCRKVLGPEHPDTLLAVSNLSRAYGAAGRRDEALKLLEQALAVEVARDPRSNPCAYLYAQVGFLRDAAGRGDQAIEAWAASVRIAPSQANVTYWLGKALFDRERYAQALPYLRAAMKLYPDGDRRRQLSEWTATAEAKQ